MDAAGPGVAVVAAIAGTALGYLIVSGGAKHGKPSTDFAELRETRIWFALAAASCGVSLAVAAILAPVWWTLFRDRGVFTQGFLVVLVVALYLVALLVPRFASDSPEYPLHLHYLRMALLYMVAFVALGMALSGMVLVAIDADANVPADAAGLIDEEATILHALELRRALQLFLGTCALLIAVAIVVTAAFRRALVAHDVVWRLPAAALLAFGGLFTALLAAVFVPSFIVVQDASWQIVTLSLEKSDLDPPDADWFELRSNLIEALALEIGVARTFAGAFAVLTPIASAYLTNYLTSDDGDDDAG